MNPRLSKGFTLLELMVVLVITLIIMGMLTTFFVTSTKVVTTVELKLRLHEQARGILDSIEQQVINACSNERGGQFGVKGTTFTDGDLDQKISPPTRSTRKLDALVFVQPAQLGLQRLANYSTTGGYPTPFYYNYSSYQLTNEDFCTATFRSNIHYGTNPSPEYPLPKMNTDVSRIVYSLSEAKPNKGPGRSVNAAPPLIPYIYYPSADAPINLLDPGQESGSSLAANPYNFFNVALMDLTFSIWDETDRKFHRVPHLHSVYFAPIPKAILVSMTVCDVQKRGRISFSRVIRPPTGTGDGHFNSSLASADTGQSAKILSDKILAMNPAETSDSNHNHRLDRAESGINLLSLPSTYQRLKKLRTTAVTPAVGDFDPAFLDTSIFKE